MHEYPIANKEHPIIKSSTRRSGLGIGHDDWLVVDEETKTIGTEEACHRAAAFLKHKGVLA